MKKLGLTLVFCLILSSFAVYADEPKTAVDENFESYKEGAFPTEGWVYDVNEGGDSTYTRVEKDPLDSGNLALKYYNNAGGLIYSRYNFTPIGGRISLQYRYMLENKSSVVQYIGLLEGVFNIMTYQGAYVMAGDVGTVMNLNPTPEVWHTATVEIDFSEKKFSYKIDDTVIGSELEFLNPDIESISTLSFISASGWVMIDDLKITYEGGIVKNYTKLETSEYYYNKNLKTVFNIPIDTEPQELMKNLSFVDGSVRGLYKADGETPWTKRFVEETAVLKIQSPDKTQELRLGIRLRPWIASTSTVETSYNCVTVFSDSCDMLVKNKKQYIDEENPSLKAYTENNKVYVPLRAICEAFGISVEYDASSKEIFVNGKAVTSEIKSSMGRSFIAAEDLAEIIDKKLLVNQNGTVVFSEKDVTVSEQIYRTFVNEINKRKGDK